MSALTEPERKILEAARKVFELHGFDGARMQQIADETGISKASLHYYFRSKERLFELIFEETMSEFLAIVSTWEEDEGGWEQKLRLFIHAFFDFLKTKSLLFIIREVNRNPELLVSWKNSMKSNRKKNRFIDYFDRLKTQGKIKDVDLHVIFIFLHSLCAYPVLNRSMFTIACKMTEKEFENLMNTYPDQVADLLIHTLRKPSSNP